MSWISLLKWTLLLRHTKPLLSVLPARVQAHMPSIHLSFTCIDPAHSHTHIHIHLHTHARTHVHTCTHMHTCTYTHVHSHMHTHIPGMVCKTSGLTSLLSCAAWSGRTGSAPSPPHPAVPHEEDKTHVQQTCLLVHLSKMRRKSYNDCNHSGK